MEGPRLERGVAVFRNLVGRPLDLYRSTVAGLRSCGPSHSLEDHVSDCPKIATEFESRPNGAALEHVAV
jgi:hypothetical protein